MYLREILGMSQLWHDLMAHGLMIGIEIWIGRLILQFYFSDSPPYLFFPVSSVVEHCKTPLFADPHLFNLQVLVP